MSLIAHFLVSDYELDDRTSGVHSLVETNYFSSSLCVQTGSEAHPASYPLGIWAPLPGGKARPGVTLTTRSHLVKAY
jgi:hypothetical protein